MSGWIKLHRKITEWEWWDDHNTTRLFIYLITKANHRDKSWRGIEIKRGQFISSLDKLVKETVISSQRIRTALKRLKATNEITSESTSQYTKYIVNNYDLYQYDQQENNTPDNKPATNNQQTNNKRITTTNNIKKEKNVKNVKETKLNISFDDVWNLYDYKTGTKDKLNKKWESLTDIERENIFKDIPLYKAETPDKKFRKHFSTYLNQRGWEDERNPNSNGVIDFEYDGTGNFRKGYCDKCNSYASYRDEELFGETRCCNAKF